MFRKFPLKRRIASVAMAAALAFGAPLSAATLNVTYQGGSAFGSPNLSRYISISSPTYTGGVYAGPFRLAGSGGLGNFVAFCVDLTKVLANGQTYTSASVSNFGNTVDTNISKLFSSAYSGINSRIKGAAFQVALWEIISDTGRGYNLGAGAFSVQSAAYSAAVINQASQYLNGLAGATVGAYTLSYLNSGTSQNIVTVANVPGSPVTPPVRPGPPISPVPVPAGLGLLGLALASLAMARMRRKAG